MNQTAEANAIFAPIWRRKWLIIAVAIIVGAASYLYYKRQRPTYQSSTQVFLGAGAEEQAPSERTASKNKGSALADQAAVINTIVVEQVRRKLRAEKGKLAREGREGQSESARKKAKS